MEAAAINKICFMKKINFVAFKVVSDVFDVTKNQQNYVEDFI